MAWQDRVLECEITSPSGVSFTLDYEDLSNSFDTRTAAFNFPDAPGTLVQQSGITGKSFPMRMFIWGDDYDLTADAFLSALSEQGRFTLQHPVYGTFQVIPVGSVTRNDALRTASNQAVFEITFLETLTEIYPSGALDAESQARLTLELYNLTQADSFNNKVDLSTAIERVSLKNSYNNFLDTAEGVLEPLSNGVETIKDNFSAIKQSINNGIDVLIGEPTTLALQTLRLLQEPANIVRDTKARLSGYANLLQNIIGGNTYTPDVDNRNENSFLTNDLYAVGIISAMSLALLNNDFTTRTEAVEGAQTLLDNFDNVNTWREENFTSLSLADTGETYAQILQLTAQTIAFLIAQSLGLAQERRIILDQSRQIIELVSELYGTIDDVLDLFIISNNLSGDEVLELQKGRELVYYV